VGNGEDPNGLQMTGLNLMDKTLAVQGARIAYSIWDVAGGNSRTVGWCNKVCLISMECEVPLNGFPPSLCVM
jgi:hypothetical protein